MAKTVAIGVDLGTRPLICTSASPYTFGDECDIKEELEKMKEQIKDIERKESDHFDCLLRWLLTSDRVTDQLAKVVDARAEMDKISIKLFKSVVEEIKTIARALGGKQSSSVQQISFYQF